ncbi:MAG: c-type cytochrome [Ferrimonas sp.]
MGLSGWLFLAVTTTVAAVATDIESSAAPVAMEVAVELTGEQLYHDYGRGGCVNCHGTNGNQPKMALVPKIGGQTALYLITQMKDYREGKRVNGLYIPMQNVMETYTEDEIERIGHYLAAQDGFAAPTHAK